MWSSRYLAPALGAAGVAVLAYALISFDRKRRSDPEFRHKLSMSTGRGAPV